MRIRYRPFVEAEVAEISDHLEEIQVGLGDRFLTDLERLYLRLLSFPESCKEVDPARLEGRVAARIAVPGPAVGCGGAPRARIRPCRSPPE